MANSEQIVATSTTSEQAGDKGRYFLLGMLLLAYVFNFIDRQIVAILQEPIKQDLGLSDTQLGMLTGFGFAFIYVTMGIPIARWADKGVRRNIIALSVGVWSFFTVVSGAATNFAQMLLARIGVGVGEAGCTPPAYSMISDSFPHHQRSVAFAVYNCGGGIGVLFGFLAGGWLNEFFGWRVAFVAVGLPGILLAVLIRLFVKEPMRGRYDPPPPAGEAPPEMPSFMEVLKYLWSKKTFRQVMFAAGLAALATNGLMIWTPSFFIRVYELEVSTVGTWFAIAGGVCSSIGALASGYLGGKLGRRDNRWYLWILVIAYIALSSLMALIFTSTDAQSALWLLLAAGLFINVPGALLVTVIHGIVPNNMRAMSAAILYLGFNVLGLGVGPLLIGIVSDMLSVTYGVDGLRYALLYTAPVAGLWCVIHFDAGLTQGERGNEGGRLTARLHPFSVLSRAG